MPERDRGPLFGDLEDDAPKCEHGKAGAHDVFVLGFPVPPYFVCPGPAVQDQRDA